MARGPRRELLTTDGWQDAQRWGLATIIDLRCEYEIGAHDGDPQIAPGMTMNVAVINAPTEDQNDPEFREVCFPILDSPEYWSHNWRILPELVRGTPTGHSTATIVYPSKTPTRTQGVADTT